MQIKIIESQNYYFKLNIYLNASSCLGAFLKSGLYNRHSKLRKWDGLIFEAGLIFEHGLHYERLKTFLLGLLLRLGLIF